MNNRPSEPESLNVPPEVSTGAGEKALKELISETDRGSAIVAGAILDDLLGQLLASYLVENGDASGQLFSSDTNAPLSSFGSRLTATYVVGLIQKHEREALRIVKRIRNRFAHDLDLNFADNSIQSQCERLAAIYPYPSDEGLDKYQPSSRQRFEQAVARLIGHFEERLYMIKQFGVSGAYSSVVRNVVALQLKAQVDKPR